jgi:hypothetical protein
MSEKILGLGTAGIQYSTCLLFTTKAVTDMLQIREKIMSGRDEQGRG